MIAYDRLSPIRGKPPHNELGLSKFECLTSWWTQSYDPETGYNDSRLCPQKMKALALLRKNKHHPVCIDDERVISYHHDNPIMGQREEEKAAQIILENNPELKFGFGGYPHNGIPVPGASFVFRTHYLSIHPIEEWFKYYNKPANRPTEFDGIPFVPFIGWQWYKHPALEKMFVPPGTWRRVCEFYKEHYNAVILWGSGTHRDVEGGPFIETLWTNSQLQELWEITKEVFELAPRHMVSHVPMGNRMKIIFNDNSQKIITPASFDELPGKNVRVAHGICFRKYNGRIHIGSGQPTENVPEPATCPNCRGAGFIEQ